jgi:MFS transporter, DHA1 family, tetracycline resistance protein
MKRRAAVPFVLVTLVLDVLAFGIIIPVLPKLIEDFLHGNTAQAARIYGLFGTVWALMQFVFAPVLGSLSDRVGRRAVILISAFGLGFDYVLMAVAPNLVWLFVGRVISGITSAAFTTGGAYIADVTPPEKRAASYGLIGAAWGFGFILGPALGGLLGTVSPRLPFWVAAVLTLLGALYGLFLLPESLPQERRRSFSWKRANPVGSLRLLRSHPELYGLGLVFFLYSVAHQVLPAVFVLYAGYRYGWSETVIGLTLTAVGVGNVIVQGGLVRPVVRRFGERVSLLTGLVFGLIGLVTFGVAAAGWTFMLGVALGAPVGFFGPGAQGLMSQRVSASDQGQLQGAIGSIRGVTGMIGPWLFTFTFAHFIDPATRFRMPGAPFLLAAALMLVALLLALRVTRDARAEPSPSPG